MACEALEFVMQQLNVGARLHLMRRAARAGQETVLRACLGEQSCGIPAQDTLDSVDEMSDRTALTAACEARSAACVRMLLEAGADADHPDPEDFTPLQMAALCGSEACVELLLNKGATADRADSDGQTPLAFAASGGHEACMRQLLDAGVVELRGLCAECSR